MSECKECGCETPNVVINFTYIDNRVEKVLNPP